MPDFGRWTSNGGDPSLNDINRVDRFFDALGSKQTAYSTDHAEAELAFLLADWRDDVRDAPVTAPVTPRDAAAALRGGLNTRKRSRTSLALVGSAAAAVLCLGGFGVAVFGSSPGDPFYGMRTTLFGQEQVRDEQVTLASQQLQQVQQLIDQGQWEQAQDKLAALSTTVQSVEAPPEQKQDLIQQWNALTYKVVEQDPAATLPPAGEPLPVLPDSPLTLLPVPVFETSTSSSTTSTTTTSTSTSSEPPGPEIALTSPTSPTETSPSETSETSAPTSPPTTTTTTTTTTTSAPTSTTSTTTTTATTTASRPPEVTSVPPAPQTAAAPPSTATQASVPASEPPRPPQSPPSSSAAPPAPPAPPVGGSGGSGPAVAPSQSEPTTVTPSAPKKPSEDEQQVVTTTVAPPR